MFISSDRKEDYVKMAVTNFKILSEDSLEKLRNHNILELLQPVLGLRNQLRTFHVRNMNVNYSMMSVSGIIRVTEKT